MIRPSVAGPPPIEKCCGVSWSALCSFFLIRLMLIYFWGGADFLIVFSLKCDGFNFKKEFFNVFKYFLRVEDTILEPILEPKKRNSCQKFWVLRPPW